MEGTRDRERCFVRVYAHFLVGECAHADILTRPETGGRVRRRRTAHKTRFICFMYLICSDNIFLLSRHDPKPSPSLCVRVCVGALCVRGCACVSGVVCCVCSPLDLAQNPVLSNMRCCRRVPMGNTREWCFNQLLNPPAALGGASVGVRCHSCKSAARPGGRGRGGINHPQRLCARRFFGA